MDSLSPGWIVFIAFFIFFLGATGAILILWVALPFSVFGTKDLIRKLIAEQKTTNELLKALLESGKDRTEDRPSKGADPQ